MVDLLDSLTEREQEILTLLVEGLSNNEIASRLHIASQTVRWYNSQIYSKLNVKNRRDAVKKATTQGILNFPVKQASRHNLPAQTTPFIGREDELIKLGTLIRDDNIRLITILASGGMGKTRLCLEASSQQMQYFTDGTFFIALAPLNSTNHIVTSIAEAFGLQFHSDRSPEQQLLDYLSDKRMLLVLDNFEHLLGAVTTGQ